MTTFQPGDVVPGEEYTHFHVAVANAAQEVTGRSIWPSTVKAVLESAEVQRATLSPQAVLDAILDMAIREPVEGFQMAPLMSRGWPIPVVARKVGGHWQVKSVGGGE